MPSRCDHEWVTTDHDSKDIMYQTCEKCPSYRAMAPTGQVLSERRTLTLDDMVSVDVGQSEASHDGKERGNMSGVSVPDAFTGTPTFTDTPWEFRWMKGAIQDYKAGDITLAKLCELFDVPRFEVMDGLIDLPESEAIAHLRVIFRDNLMCRLQQGG